MGRPARMSGLLGSSVWCNCVLGLLNRTRVHGWSPRGGAGQVSGILPSSVPTVLCFAGAQARGSLLRVLHAPHEEEQRMDAPAI